MLSVAVTSTTRGLPSRSSLTASSAVVRAVFLGNFDFKIYYIDLFVTVCGAPKRRFRAYEPSVSKDANDQDVRKARKAQLKRDEAVGYARNFEKSIPLRFRISNFLHDNVL